MKEVAETKRILEEEQPEKVITLGGTCLVSQAPFDYLKGKYGDDLGIIWIDAHSDISTPEETNEAHTMVLGNLIGAGNQALSEQVEHPFKADEVLYVGLQNLHEKEQKLLDQHGFNYQVQKDGILSAESVRQWILDNDFKKIAVHFDIDVLSPAVFRDTYMAEPGIESFPSAAGKMDFNGLKEIFNAVFSSSEVVGLTVCEYMPFDAVNLKSYVPNTHTVDDKVLKRRERHG